MGDRYNFLIFERIRLAMNSPQWPGLEDNEQRIKFILGKIDSELIKRILSDVTIVEKSLMKSCEFRAKGNCFFTWKEGSRLDDAVEEYTKSVAYAPTGSQELSLAYANRSAVLFKARLISDCLLDIERALENNYPDNLKAKLYLRKAMCLQVLKPKNHSSIKRAFIEARMWVKEMDREKQKIMEEMLAKQEKVTSIDKSTFLKCDGKKFLHKLSAENPRFPGVSDAVEMQYSKKYGRHMVATRDIEPGEVISLQKPHFKVVTVSARYLYCWNCGEQTWAGIPCETCVQVVFCSEACREQAMLEHHEIECPIIPSLIASDCNSSKLMPLRIIVRTLKEMNNSFETWKQCVEKIDAEKNPLLKEFTNNVLESNKFSSVYGSWANQRKSTMITSLFHISDSIVVAFLLATRSRYFGSKMNDDLRILSSDKNFVFVVGLLEKLSKLPFQASDFENKGHSVFIPVSNFFNHSCFLMVTSTAHNDYVATRALRPIKKDQQIFFTYLKNYQLLPKKERQEYLLSNFDFHCDCEACENDWPQGVLEPKDYTNINSMNTLSREASLLVFQSNDKTISLKIYRNINFNFEKEVARVVTALKKFYRLHLQPYSFEIKATTQVLLDLIDLTKNRFLTLDTIEIRRINIELNQ